MIRRVVLRAAALVCEVFVFFWAWVLLLALFLVGTMKDPDTAEMLWQHDESFMIGAVMGLFVGALGLIFTWSVAGLWGRIGQDMGEVVHRKYKALRAKQDYEEGVSTVEEFREAWGQAMRGETKPISELWKEFPQ